MEALCSLVTFTAPLEAAGQSDEPSRWRPLRFSHCATLDWRFPAAFLFDSYIFLVTWGGNELSCLRAYEKKYRGNNAALFYSQRRWDCCNSTIRKTWMNTAFTRVPSSSPSLKWNTSLVSFWGGHGAGSTGRLEGSRKATKEISYIAVHGQSKLELCLRRSLPSALGEKEKSESKKTVISSTLTEGITVEQLRNTPTHV